MKTRLRRSIRIFEGEMTSFLTENGQNACFVAYLKREFDADYFSNKKDGLKIKRF